MNLEIEAKFRVPSHEPIRERLLAAGAKRLGCVLETNDILDATDGSLRARGCGLRVRTTVDETTGERLTTMTFKGPVGKGPFKSREEREVRVDGAESVLHILERLGFVRILRFQKRRESWSLDDCRVELDEPPHLGLFVEIEGPGESAIDSLRKKLGLEGVPHERASYVRMLSEYCTQHGITDRIVQLDSPDTTR